MPTEFSKIYDRAVFKLTDYSFLTDSTSNKEMALQSYLMSSIVDFMHSCTKVDLTDYDEVNKRFNVELDTEIIEILATGIAYHWLNAKALNSSLLKNAIYKSDYKQYSPANLLSAIKSLKDTFEQDFKGKISAYSHRFGNADSRKV